MKKLLLILLGSLAMACGDGSGRQEAAADEDVEIGSGEAISPQLELDSTDTRFDVDTVSSHGDGHEETRGDDF